jgi:transcriptional regulator with XRE-family HTH domain
MLPDMGKSSGLRAQVWGRHIKAARAQRGWTLDRLAGRLDVTHQTVSRWEHGKPPRLDHCFDLAGVLGVPFDDLFPMLDDRR